MLTKPHKNQIDQPSHQELSLLQCLGQIIKKLFILPFRVLEHNSEHATKINVLGEEINACSRCLGMYASAVVGYFLFAYVYLYTNIRFSFWFVFIASASLGSVTLVDWLSVDFFHVRKGNNKIRIFAGVLLGIGGTFYFWLLPMSWFFRITSLILYLLIAIVIIIVALGRDKLATQTNKSVRR